MLKSFQRAIHFSQEAAELFEKFLRVRAKLGECFPAQECQKPDEPPRTVSKLCLDKGFLIRGRNNTRQRQIRCVFREMLQDGALDEVRTLLALHLDPALPAMRAHGVPELAAHLRGEITLEEAGRRIELATGQYTKRQATWFRHHRLADPAYSHMIHARITGLEQFSESIIPQSWEFIESMA